MTIGKPWVTSRMKIWAVAGVVFLAPGFSSFSHAQDQGEERGSYDPGVAPARRIAMSKGQSRIIDLPQDAAEIFIANPNVANAVVRSPRKIYIIGMDGGQTSFYALDQKGRQIAAYELSINAPPAFRIDIVGLQKMLSSVLPGTDIRARLANDTIILTGTAETAEEAQKALEIARAFRTRTSMPGIQGETTAQSQTTNVSNPIINTNIPANQNRPQDTGGIVNLITIRGRSQVMLKVAVAEISRDIVKQLGLTTSSLTASWGTFTQFNPFPINGVIAPAAVTTGANALATAAQNGTATAITANNPSNTLSATLQAFERYGVTRILAEPTVSAVSGESASLTVGGEIPIPGPTTCQAQGCAGGGANFYPYGVTLGFTPTVLSEGRIELHLSTEVTEIDTQNSATVYGTLVPGFLTRKNETTVEIPSGGSIASAGLLQNITRTAVNGLPGLLDIPVLGALFRSNDYQRNETELLIVVTPYIAKPVKSNEIAKPTDGFTDATDPQTWLLGRMNQLYASPGNPEALKDYKGPVGFILQD